MQLEIGPMTATNPEVVSGVAFAGVWTGLTGLWTVNAARSGVRLFPIDTESDLGLRPAGTQSLAFYTTQVLLPFGIVSKRVASVSTWCI